jgi:hypothetical protein
MGRRSWGEEEERRKRKQKKKPLKLQINLGVHTVILLCLPSVF